MTETESLAGDEYDESGAGGGAGGAAVGVQPSGVPEPTFPKLDKLDVLVPLRIKKEDGHVVETSWKDYLSSGRKRPFELVVDHPRTMLLAAPLGGAAPSPSDPGLLPFFARIANIQSLAQGLGSGEWKEWTAAADQLRTIAKALEEELQRFTVEAPGKREAEPCESTFVVSGPGLGMYRMGEIAPVRSPGKAIPYTLGTGDNAVSFTIKARRLGQDSLLGPGAASSSLRSYLFGRGALTKTALVYMAVGAVDAEPWVLDVSPVLKGTKLAEYVKAQYPGYPTMSTCYPSTIGMYGAVNTSDGGAAVNFTGINPESLSQAVVVELLSTPDHTAADHGVVTTEGELMALGNESSFSKPYGKEASGRHSVNFRSLLLCCPELSRIEVHKTILKPLKQNPVSALLGWLSQLAAADEHVRKLRRLGALGKKNRASAASGMGFPPGSMRSMCQTWIKMRELLETREGGGDGDGDGDTAGTAAISHGRLFTHVLEGAALFYDFLVSNHGKGPLALYHMDLETKTLEDTGAGDVEAPSDEHLDGSEDRGTLTDAVWELLAMVDPLACTPDELFAIISVVTKFERFSNQDRLPPSWQAHSLLLHTALRGGANESVINFCASHANDANDKGVRPLHVVVNHATAPDADLALAANQIKWLLAAGADPDGADSNGLTALCNAASGQLHSLFVTLVKGGACGGQHTWALIEYKRVLGQVPDSPVVAVARQAIETVAMRNRKLAWYFAWNVLLPSTSSRADCIFQTESFSSCKVDIAAKNELFRSDGSFNTINVFGRRLVGKVGTKHAGGLYLKVRPELPGVEAAVRELARLLFGVNAMPYVELVRWSKKVPGTKGLGPGTPVLVSQGVSGLTLQEVFAEKRDPELERRLLGNLEPDALSEALLIALLTMPEDGKPDNYICEPTGTGQYRLIGIDNDHAFAPPVATEKGHKELKVKCCLFCLDQMMDQVTEKTRNAILYIDAVALIRKWIMVLKKRHAAHARLFCNEEEVIRLLRDKKEPCALGVPFRTGAVKRLCDKLVRMQNLLNASPNCTHLELMAEVEPMLAVRYRMVLDKKMSVGARFREVDGAFFSRVMAGQYESMFNSRQMLSMNLLGVKMDGASMMRMLKGEEHGPVQALAELNSFASQWKAAALQEFMENRGFDMTSISTLPANQIEDILSSTNFQDVTVTTQQVLLEALTAKDLRRLEITNCIAMQDRILETMFEFRSLVSLKLFGCLQLNMSFKVLEALSTKCLALQELVLSDLPLPRRFAKAGVASLKQLELPNLRSAYIFRCPALTEVKLHAPLLENLSVDCCPRLAVLDVFAPGLQQIDVRECPSLQERELSVFMQGLGGAGGPKFINIELFGLDPDTTRTVYGPSLIRSMLSEAGERHWSVAKRIASVADSGPRMDLCVLVEPEDPEVMWRAAYNIFVISRNDPAMVRDILAFEKETMWDLAMNVARVSVAQRNDQMAQQILAIGAKVNLECAAAIAGISVTNVQLGVQIMKIGQQVGWEVAQNLAEIGIDDQSLAAPLITVGWKQNWQVAQNLIGIAVKDKSLITPIMAVGADGNWEAVACLGHVAVRNPGLARSILSIGKTVSWQMAISLARFASDDRSVSQLNLFNCGLTKQTATSIAGVLKSNSSLRTLVIFGNNLEDVGGSVIVSTLEEESLCLSELWLWDCGVGLETARAFGQALKVNRVLTIANFRGHAFGDDGGVAIAEGLAENLNLEELKICKCGLGKAAGKAFQKALTKNTRLKILELSYEQFEDAGGAAIAAGVGASKSLQELYIYKCGLSSASAMALATALTTNSSLRILDLFGDAITDEGCASIVGALGFNQSVAELRLWRCQAGDATVKALDSVLEANKTLELLILSADGISNDGLKLLAGRLQACSLKEVRLMRRGLSAEVLDMFAGAQCKVRFL